MSVHQWATPHAVETLLSTELDSLALQSTVLSGIVDNTVGYKLADFEIVGIGAGAPGGNGGFFALYLILSEDGTNYEDDQQQTYTLTGSGITGVGIGAKLIGTVGTVNRSGGVRSVLRLCDLPPCKFKVLLYNAASNQLSSGNTLKMLRYNEADG